MDRARWVRRPPGLTPPHPEASGFWSWARHRLSWPRPSDAQILAALQDRLAAGADRRQAVADVAHDLHLPKREVYQPGPVR